jgi:hypothetical protein
MPVKTWSLLGVLAIYGIEMPKALTNAVTDHVALPAIKYS